jgi:MraZ protein
MQAFVGESEHTLDEKSRLIVPQRHRGALVDGHFLVKGLDGCLWLMPAKTFERIDAQLQKESIFDEETRDFERLFYSGIDGVLDAQGRLTISPALRKYAGMGDDQPVIVVGTRNRLEIWSRDRWEVRSARVHAQGPTIAQKFRGVV